MKRKFRKSMLPTLCLLAIASRAFAEPAAPADGTVEKHVISNCAVAKSPEQGESLTANPVGSVAHGTAEAAALFAAGAASAQAGNVVMRGIGDALGGSMRATGEAAVHSATGVASAEAGSAVMRAMGNAVGGSIVGSATGSFGSKLVGSAGQAAGEAAGRSAVGAVSDFGTKLMGGLFSRKKADAGTGATNTTDSSCPKPGA